MNAAAWLLAGAARRAGEGAFVFQGQRLTHREFADRVRAFASALEAAGVRPGDRAAILAVNSPDSAVALLGCMYAGAVAVPLPPGDSEARVARMVAKAKPSIVFVDDRAAAIASAVAPGARLLRTADLAPLAGAVSPATAEHPALVLFTSGSTGEPRGVVISHENVIANTTSILASLPIQADDRIMAVLPLYYSFGASILFTHLRAGACVVINNRFMFADRVLEEIVREECTSFAGVPSTYQILLRRSRLPSMKLPSLRYVQQAGGRLSPVFVRELAERLPGVAVYLMYGQTEATARLTCLDPAMVATKSHTIGKPIPGVTLEVVRADGSPAPQGEVGELVARGPGVALGYLDEPEATAETFRGGTRSEDRALYTGDLGKVDEDGFFIIVDRAKEFLKCAGYRVSMKEVEELLLSFEGVVEAAVVGVPDDLQGEAVQAFVVHPEGEAARTALDVHCKRAMPQHLQPKAIVFLDALPKTAAGKLARDVLRERAGAA